MTSEVRIKNVDDVTSYKEPEVGLKFDDEKPDWSLLPMRELQGVVRVLMHGERKYSRDNWKHVPLAEQRYYAALMRHLTAYQSGQTHDPESELHHLDHAMCCLLFLRHFSKGKK